jgi:polyisoprenoid-binding protein YceI
MAYRASASAASPWRYTEPSVQAVQAKLGSIALAVDPAQSTIHWTLDSSLHTIHGTFAIKSGKFDLNPDGQSVSGEIRVDPASGESGNQSRDNRMHKEILEVSRFTEVVFHAQSAGAKMSTSALSDLQLQGTLSLHGSDHPITVPVHLELTGDHWKGTGKFQIPYVEWGLKDPSNFLLKAAKVVDIDVLLAGDLQQTR